MLVNKAETIENYSVQFATPGSVLHYEETELTLIAADIQQREEELNKQDVGR